MRKLYQRRAARGLIVTVLAGLVATAASNAPTAAAPAESIVVVADSTRLRVQSPFLLLEFDLRRPALDVLRSAPNGDGQYGGSIGFVVEEASGGGRRFQSNTDDADGVRALWLRTPGGVNITLDGIDVGPAVNASWTVTMAEDSPSLRIDRQLRLRGGAPLDSVGLAVVSATAPEGIDPSSLARVLDLVTYRPEIGPAQVDQAGGVIGLLAVDNPELSFSARTDGPDRVVARQQGNLTGLTLLRGVAADARQGDLLQNGVVFQFGLDNDLVTAHSDVAPQLESRLLASGYYGNAILSPSFGGVLSASMRDYRGSVWSRDTDYGMQGYSYVLSDMSVFRNTLEKFLDRVDDFGVAPEYLLLDGRHGNRQSWDSMANVVQATHTYVAKTGDLDFYRRHEGLVKKALNWISALDTNGDGLPDRDIFPFGYTDTVENGPMHTYAIAKHFGAFLATAELDDAIGKDGQPWRNYARLTQRNFGRTLAEGGYWNPGRGYPIAWKRADGRVYANFETFGVFEAIRVGLLHEDWQLQSIATWLDANREAFINGNAYPERLMIDGYDLGTKKAEVPVDKLWIMDSNAPWISGISVPARVRLGRLTDARDMLVAYASSANRRTPHAEFGAGPAGRYGPGETADGGRLWDNWSWFSAIYGTHFGLKMTIPALEIAPAPLDPGFGRRLSDVVYQGARVQMELLDDGYRLMLDAPRTLVLRPPLGYDWISLNGDATLQAERTLVAEPGLIYVIQAYR